MKQGQFSADGMGVASPVRVKQSSFDLVTFGGCTLNLISELLAKFGNSRHYWRHSVIADMCPAPQLRTVDLGDERASRTLIRYLNKYHLEKIRSSAADAYVFECASDYAFEYLRVENSIIPDIRSDLFSDGWASLSFSHIPELENAQKISADDGFYWKVWISSFELFYKNVLIEKISEGCKIFFVRRYLSPHNLTENGTTCIDDPSIFIRNSNLRRVYEQLDKMSGIDFIDPPAELHVTSSNAPSGGPWEMHPEEEYYTYVAGHILREMVEDQSIADQFWSVRMAQSAAARCAAQMQLISLESKIDKIRQENEKLLSRNAGLLQESKGFQRKIEELGSWAHTLHKQRDELFEQNKHISEKLESANRDIGYLTRKCENEQVKNRPRLEGIRSLGGRIFGRTNKFDSNP